MPRSLEQLRHDAMAIWLAGVKAVRADRLVLANLRVARGRLECGDESIDLNGVGRIAVVGAGKAGAAMAAAVELALGPAVASEKRLTGWVNVPADTVLPLGHIHLHAARAAGVNEPTAEGQHGAQQVVQLVEDLGPDDLCLVLLSGGGSALLPLPVQGVSLADKLAVTRHLSAAGATIEELNCVRKRLSRIKGGGLARACRAGRLVALIVSDVLGDSLDVIASGPTIADASPPEAAMAVLQKYEAGRAAISPAVFDTVSKPRAAAAESTCRVTNLVIGNNAMAVDAAGLTAEGLGYSHAMVSATGPEGTAEDVGAWLAVMAQRMRDQQGPDCLISGGEPVVRLVDEAERGLGGRNQQLVLAALAELATDGAGGLVILSAGTDGEDGPTDAAGGIIDGRLLIDAKARNIDLTDYLRRNDAYTCLDRLGALVRTGPTGTNVCDLRIVLVDRVELSDRRSGT